MALDPRIAMGVQPFRMEPRAVAEMRAMQMMQEQRRNALMQMQMEGVQQERAAQQAQAQQMNALRGSIESPQMAASRNALAGGGGPTTANAARMAPVDPRQQMLHQIMQAGGMSPLDYVEKTAPAQTEVKDYKQVRMPDGSVTIVGLTKDGRVVPTNQQPFENPEVRSFGGYNGAFDPITGKTTNIGAITQSADNRASVGAQYANAAATRAQADATRDAAKITANVAETTGLRKEFADLPEVKKFKNAIPAYQAIVQAAKINNPQADINLIYGLAKLYDPDSVVREGEYDTIANSQSIPEWLKGQAQRLAGGGKLTQETKNQIVEQANIRINSYKGEYDGARSGYEGIATGRGLPTQGVFAPVGRDLNSEPSGKVPPVKMPTAADIAAEAERRRQLRGK